MSPADALKNEVAGIVLLVFLVCWIVLDLWMSRPNARGHKVGDCLGCGAELREADVFVIHLSRLPEQRGVLCGGCSRDHFRSIV